MDRLQDTERVSVLLSKVIERKILGTPEVMDARRKSILGQEYLMSNDDVNIICCGSRPEGISLLGSDVDTMTVHKHVEVMYPEDNTPLNNTGKLVFYVGKAQNCQPGYVTLQLSHYGQIHVIGILVHALVPVGNVLFISSDMHRQLHVTALEKLCNFKFISSGPSSSSGYADVVACFHMSSWPKEANQWVTRTRLCGWPTQAMIDKIVQMGCYVVPVGDKSSNDTLLQWRLSFAPAERFLVHTFSYIQMKVYYLLKYFLKQIKPTMQKVIGMEDDDILCSYHLKTVMFFSLENAHPKLWQEQNLFYCFWFCFNVLISCVRAGQLPQYFIPTNNLFRRKVHGQNQQKLFHILDQFHSKKILCLLNVHGTTCRVNILEYISNADVQTQLMRAQTVQDIEYSEDMFVTQIFSKTRFHNRHTQLGGVVLKLMSSLMKSQSDIDEAVIFTNIVDAVCELAKRAAQQNLTEGLNNKTRYQTLRKCQHKLTLCASLGTFILDLATFCFLTGNYSKALQMCQHITSQPSYLTYGTFLSEELETMYKKQYCGRGYTLIDRVKKTLVYPICAKKESTHLPCLDLEVSRNPAFGVPIPSLPYALFLSFLCCHELRDKRGRDEALRHMIMVKSHELQGRHWTVHTMLGICFETIGDYHSAIRVYLDSANTPKRNTEKNPYPERIDALLRSMS